MTLQISGGMAFELVQKITWNMSVENLSRNLQLKELGRNRLEQSYDNPGLG